MGSDLLYSTLYEDRRLTIEVLGTLDLGPSHELRRQLDLFIDRGLSLVEFDLARTECVTSVGISALAYVWERCREKGIPVEFANVSRNLVRLFEVAGVREVLLGTKVRTPDAS